MSAVDTITKVATGVIGGVRRTAAAVVHGGRSVWEAAGPSDHAPEPAPPPPAAASPDRHVEPAEPIQPAEPVEPSTTEPKAASREAAHQGRGTEPSDDWHDEIDDAPDVGTNPATGRPNAQQDDDEPLIDPSVARSVRSEAETMRKASDPER